MIQPSERTVLPAAPAPTPGSAHALPDRSEVGLLVQEYLDDLECRVSASHYKNVKSRLGRTVAALGLRDLSDLQPVQVIRHRNQRRADGASNRTANLVVDTLNGMLAWALGCGLIESNPLRNLRRLPDGAGYQRYRRRAMTDGEIDRFLQCAREDDERTAATWSRQGGGAGNRRRLRLRVPQAPLWLAFLETGARWGELTQTRWCDWDLADRTMVLRAETTKSRKRRVLPLRRELVAVLEELRPLHAAVLGRDLRPADPVFLTPEGSRWMRPTNNAMRLFDRVLRSAEIPRVDDEGRKLDIHSLRHPFGSRLARNGVGLVQVQCLMGHSDPKLTAQVYTHLDVEDLRRAVESV